MTQSAFAREERLRFVDFQFTTSPNGRCRAEVTLGFGADARWMGSAEGLASDAGEMRCSAEATLHAIEASAGGAISFELLGVKAVRAFDTIVLIVSVVSRESGQTHRLVGSFLADQEHTRGAALAILNATNRVMGNIFAREPS
ncbi:MAG: hypothetical protein OEY20_11350 [Gemmatimonadota bacterium]|nr:hypothetical protein [Gemmatimonadota bacterium]MDH4350291.1 hypothetical protein [Gemmatimonadota bacterium]MDH5197836.1 hypothetical protein [Gemmatimonadota bacterium]